MYFLIAMLMSGFVLHLHHFHRPIPDIRRIFNQEIDFCSWFLSSIDTPFLFYFFLFILSFCPWIEWQISFHCVASGTLFLIWRRKICLKEQISREMTILSFTSEYQPLTLIKFDVRIDERWRIKCCRCVNQIRNAKNGMSSTFDDFVRCCFFVQSKQESSEYDDKTKTGTYCILLGEWTEWDHFDLNRLSKANT